MSLVGYVATRLLGPDKGVALTGLSGGLVSSTAVALSFARQGKHNPDMSGPLACGVLLSWVAMFGRILVAVGAVNFKLLPSLAVPVASMAVVAIGFAGWLYFRDVRHEAKARSEEQAPQDEDDQLKVKNPFNLFDAAKFGALFAIVLLAVKIVQQYFPSQGVYYVAGLAGTTDVDAISLSMAGYAEGGHAQAAVVAIVIAALSNTLVKSIMVGALAPWSMSRWVLVAGALILAIGLAAIGLAVFGLNAAGLAPVAAM
jgi:uncharacterized membrane protein (DUF4010 family)